MNKNTKTFEENMQRLEQIVRAMERGDVALEASLKLFQEGTDLVKSCSKLLDAVLTSTPTALTQSSTTPPNASSSRFCGMSC